MCSKKSLYIIVFVALFFSCVKAPITNQNTPATFSEVFDQYWSMMNINYLYWDIDPTDWNDVYARYKPLFSKLNLNNTADLQTGAQYFQAMSNTLIDHHFSINFLPLNIADLSNQWIPNSQLEKYKIHLPIPSYWRQNPRLFRYQSFWNLDTATYFKNNYIYGADITDHTNNPFKAVLSISHQILYFSFNQFNLTSIYYSQNPTNPAWKVIDSFLYILNNLSKNKIQGIIIDIRENGGGDVNDLNFLVGRFINKPLQIGHTKYKSGNGRLSYTPFVPAYINPLPEGTQNITIPIIALVDIFSASAAELTAMGIKALPNRNGKIVGDTTFGATGPYTSDSAIWNDGPFSIANFMDITTSSGQFLYINGKSYEGKGFPPDVLIRFNLNSFFQQSKDLQLEKAFNQINNTIVF